MDAKVGDKVALDAKKVGQPKRQGVIKAVTKGLSGARYNVSWDDGTASIISPSLGNLTVQAGKKNSKSPKAKAGAKKAGPKKAGAKKKKSAKR